MKARIREALIASHLQFIKDQTRSRLVPRDEPTTPIEMGAAEVFADWYAPRFARALEAAICEADNWDDVADSDHRTEGQRIADAFIAAFTEET